MTNFLNLSLTISEKFEPKFTQSFDENKKNERKQWKEKKIQFLAA